MAPIDPQTWAEERLKTGCELLSKMTAQTPYAERADIASSLIYLLGQPGLFSFPSIQQRDELVEKLSGMLARTAPPEEQSANMISAAGYYWSVVGRPGRAIALLREALADPALRVDHRAGAMSVLAMAYLRMGNLEAADAAMRESVALGARIPDPVQRETFLNDLTLRRLLIASQQEDREAILAVWADIERSLHSTTAPEPVELRLARALEAWRTLSRIGAVQEARKARDFVERTYVGSLAQSGWPRGAIRPLMSCLDIYAASSDLARDRNFPARYAKCRGVINAIVDPEFRGNVARALELSGEFGEAAAIYEAAIAKAEDERASFGVQDRGSFLDGRYSEFFWGAVRARVGAAHEAPPNGGDIKFFDAVAAVERTRARQFSDLAGAAKGLSNDELYSYSIRLPADTVVVLFSSQNEAQPVLVFGRNPRSERLVIPGSDVSRAQVDALVQPLLERLSDPASDVLDLERRLMALSSQMLGKAQPMLARARRIIVLADGPSALIPFALWSARADAYAPFAAQSEIVYATSLRDLKRTRATTAAGGFFGVGDPIFAPLPDWPAAVLQDDAGASTRGVVARRDGVLTLPPLPATRSEVEGILAQFPPPSLTSLFGAAATEAAVKKAELSGIRYLHFATHGLQAGDSPGLVEPALALTAGEGEDGFLMASEVQSLKLNADLTVLSACNTGTGRVVDGEGVMGLSRAFLVAGSQAVLASLWPVDDAVTEAFMKDFYARLRAGATPALALRETSEAIRAVNPHPSYWAPFILVSS
jgi:tetratricopeptide (TPR) repeat protein